MHFLCQRNAKPLKILGVFVSNGIKCYSKTQIRKMDDRVRKVHHKVGEITGRNIPSFHMIMMQGENIQYK